MSVDASGSDRPGSRASGSSVRRVPERLTAVLCAVVAIAALAGVGPAAAGAAAATDPLLGAARLQGSFQMIGVITAAVGVPGERLGQTFGRVWSFTPLCAAGSCAAVALTRPRAGATDRILLLRRAPGVYSGSARFFAAVRCHGRFYANGDLVPFTITVTVDAAVVPAPGAPPVVTQLQAAYRNRRRLGRTRCVNPPRHDAASYIGQLLTPTG